MEYNSEDLKNEIARSNYAGMLHDEERNQKYFLALKHVVNKLKHSGFNSVNVLDIGTGTGILSMMAAKAGATGVTGCEMFEPMSRTARQIVRENEVNHLVEIVNKCSSDLSVPIDMKTKADVLVTEIFDSELLGEGMLPILRDAHDRLLKANAKVIPECADVNIQLIESSKLWSMNKLIASSCNLNIPREFEECPGTASGHECQINQLYPDRMKLLSEAEYLTTFSLGAPHRHNITRKVSVVEKQVQIRNSGVMHAVLFWWDLHLNREAGLVLSMEPIWKRTREEEYVWRDHWMQVVYYLRRPLPVSKGDHVFVKMYYDDYSVWFDVVPQANWNTFVDRPLCTCGLHLMWPRERFSMWNDRHVRSNFQRFARDSSNETTVVGDISLLPFYIDKSLTYVEYSESTFDVIQRFAKSNFVSDRFKVISKPLTESILNSGTILCEPYFSSCLLPWDHIFCTWDIVNLSSNAMNICMGGKPIKAQLKGCVVELKNLWKVRAPIQNVEGFDLTSFDELIQEALSPVETEGVLCEAVEPFSMWEYENTLLSTPTKLAEFSLSDPVVSYLNLSGCINVEKNGVGHAIVLWVDYTVEDDVYLTTGLHSSNYWVDYFRQGVYFMKQPHSYQHGYHIDYTVVVLPASKEILFRFGS